MAGEARTRNPHITVLAYRGVPAERVAGAVAPLAVGELGRVGAEVAGWSQPATWSPHITLLDRELDPAGLARAVAWLAQRPHPSWSVAVDRVVLTGGGTERYHADVVLPFGGGTT